MRQHLARSIGLSQHASEEEIKEVMDEKLETVLHGEGGMERRASSTKSLCSHGLSRDLAAGNRWRTSSFSEGLNADVTIDNSHVTSSVFEVSPDHLAVNSNNLESAFVRTENEACDSIPTDQSDRLFHRVNELTTVNSIQSSDKSSVHSRSSRCHIPSFSDFRKRKRSEKKRPVSTSFEFLIEEPIKEEPEMNDLQYVSEGERSNSSNVKCANDKGATSNHSGNKQNNRLIKSSSLSLDAEQISKSSQNIEILYCDCPESIHTQESSTDLNQNSVKCSKCGKLRKTVVPDAKTHSKQTRTDQPKGILKTKNDLETVLLETSPRQTSEETLKSHNRKWRKKIQETEVRCRLKWDLCCYLHFYTSQFQIFFRVPLKTSAFYTSAYSCFKHFLHNACKTNTFAA